MTTKKKIKKPTLREITDERDLLTAQLALCESERKAAEIARWELQTAAKKAKDAEADSTEQDRHIYETCNFIRQASTYAMSLGRMMRPGTSHVQLLINLSDGIRDTPGAYPVQVLIRQLMEQSSR